MVNFGSSRDASVKRLAATIKDGIRASPRYSKERCIYRVPDCLRETNEQAYTPRLVSIGPLHYKDSRFLTLEAHKLMYLESFLSASQTNAGVDLTSYIKFVKSKESHIRDYYADLIDLSSDEFTKMIVIDSVFIIEYFRRHCYSNLQGDDYIFSNPFMRPMVDRDIRLAENQIPLFIIVHLYRIAFNINQNSNDDIMSFTDVACKSLHLNRSKISIDGNTNEASCLHLLDLVRSHYKPISPRIEEANVNNAAINVNKCTVCPSATNLHEAGVKLQVLINNNVDDSSLLSIQFEEKKGILTIPKLVVEDSTENRFRNLIAFEQCHYRYRDSYFTDYQYFLNCLINTPEDVQLLSTVGIIEKWMGSKEEVCDFIISSSKNTHISKPHYDYMGVTQQLISHCNKRWNRYRAALNHTYLKHPWAVISLVYAAILLIFTSIQVALSIRAAIIKKE